MPRKLCRVRPCPSTRGYRARVHVSRRRFEALVAEVLDDLPEDAARGTPRTSSSSSRTSRRRTAHGHAIATIPTSRATRSSACTKGSRRPTGASTRRSSPIGSRCSASPLSAACADEDELWSSRSTSRSCTSSRTTSASTTTASTSSAGHECRPTAGQACRPIENRLGAVRAGMLRCRSHPRIRRAWRSSWCAAPGAANTSKPCWSATACGSRSRAGCRSPRPTRSRTSSPSGCGGASTRPRIDVAARARRLAREYGLPRPRRRALVGPADVAVGIVHARRPRDPRLVPARRLPGVGARLRARPRARPLGRAAPRPRARRARRPLPVRRARASAS